MILPRWNCRNNGLSQAHISKPKDNIQPGNLASVLHQRSTVDSPLLCIICLFV